MSTKAYKLLKIDFLDGEVSSLYLGEDKVRPTIRQRLRTGAAGNYIQYTVTRFLVKVMLVTAKNGGDTLFDK